MSAPATVVMPAALHAAGITKTFGAHRALDAVDLTLRSGEVHGLLGENGSGKSTIIKILCGFHRPDAGTLRLAGNDVALPLSPERSGELGLRFVHQDLGLIPTLTVAENFALAQLAQSHGSRTTSDRTMARLADSVLQRYGVQLDPRAIVTTLSGVERAMLAIVRAISGLDELTSHHQQPLTRVLVLDEPTVFLPRRDVQRLFALVTDLAQRGCAILLVSHDLDEIAEITDHVTIFRDGKLAGSSATGALSRADMVNLIVGRHIERTVTTGRTRSTEVPALAVRGLSGGLVRDVSFDVGAGEIVGLTGLGGAGFDEVPYLLYGARRAQAGTLTLRTGDAEPVGLAIADLKPHRALQAGMVLLPADRRRTAGLNGLSLDDNLSLPRLHRFRGLFGLRRGAIRSDTRTLLNRFDVRPPDPKYVFGTLSGGNQQKALLGKWLQVEPDIVLVDEPTQGVDIGARAQIFELFREFTATGRAVICASTDHEQLALLTDRTLVFSRGRIVAELSGADLTKQRLTEVCLEGAAS